MQVLPADSDFRAKVLPACSHSAGPEAAPIAVDSDSDEEPPAGGAGGSPDGGKVGRKRRRVVKGDAWTSYTNSWPLPAGR